MPVNHGIYRKRLPDRQKGDRLTPDEAARFRYGIRTVFQALISGPFLTSNDDKMRAVQLEFHFRKVCERFVFGLQHLNALMQTMARDFELPPFRPGVAALPLHAGYHADHILTYLNTIVDDIAQVIVLLTGVSHPKQRAESMGDLKHPAVIGLPALAPINSLLSELNNPGSWWDFAFKPHAGARQLLIHNQHLITFQGAKSPGADYEAQAILHSPLGKTNPIGILAHMRSIFGSLCDWLDRLEAALTTHMHAAHPTWSPPPQCPFLCLPVGGPQGPVVCQAAYFPLPTCDGSDPLPWTENAVFG
jgi:hypothetical protein